MKFLLSLFLSFSVWIGRLGKSVRCKQQTDSWISAKNYSKPTSRRRWRSAGETFSAFSLSIARRVEYKIWRNAKKYAARVRYNAHLGSGRAEFRFAQSETRRSEPKDGNAPRRNYREKSNKYKSERWRLEKIQRLKGCWTDGRTWTIIQTYLIQN